MNNPGHNCLDCDEWCDCGFDDEPDNCCWGCSKCRKDAERKLSNERSHKDLTDYKPYFEGKQ